MSNLRNNYGLMTNVEYSTGSPFLTDDGGFGGSRNLAIDASLSPQDFYFDTSSLAPLSKKIYLTRLGVVFNSSSVGTIADYGTITGGVTNGIRFFQEIDGNKSDFFAINAVKRTADYHLCKMVQTNYNINASDNLFLWEIDYLSLISIGRDVTNQKVGLTISDDFSTLAVHYAYLSFAYQHQPV